MTLRLRALAPLLLTVAAVPAHTAAADAVPVDWPSMSTAKVAAPLPPAGPMATDLAPKEAAKPADVPLPPPPPGMKRTSAASAAAPAPATAGATGAAATGAGLAAVAAADTSPEKATEPGKPGEPKTTMAMDQTGAMISVSQDLESDKLRRDWAAAGGSLPGFELNGGMTVTYQDLTSLGLPAGSYSSGVGFNFGGRVVLYNLTPPSYETRDRNWVAWKIGGGVDFGMIALTSYMPAMSAGGFTIPASTSNQAMTTMTLVGTVGFMYAFGSFDSPTDWSGLAVGADWAPSYQSTSITDSQTNKTISNSAFNASGFAINFESGSMQSIAAKMGKKARLKLSFFFLPPVDKLPFMMTGSVGAVWY